MATIDLDNATPHLPASPVFPAAAVGITPSNDDEFSHAVAVYVGVAGDVAVTPWGTDGTVVFKGLAAGSMLPCMVRKVLEAGSGTTATDLIAVY